VNGFFWDTIVTTNTDGILNIFLFDFENNKIFLDRYYRFVWDDEYLMFADFAIFDPNNNPELQANFMPYNDTVSGNPLKFIFKDQSIGTSIKAWSWDFGDGTTSTVQDPEHIYSDPGLYMVTLTVNSLPPEFGESQTSTITKQVQVGLRQYQHLGGHVFAQLFPIDFGLAYLYTFDENNNLVPLDTTSIDTLGYYYFYEVPTGRYLTKARLQSSSTLYGQFMPTYFGDVYDWNDAYEITISNTNNWECNIALLPSVGFDAGSGQISGHIAYDTSKFNRVLIPAGDIEIVLLSSSGNCLTCKLSAGDGHFNFDNVPFGTYKLFPDVAGILTTPMYVTISEDIPVIEDLSMVIFPGEIMFSVNENSSEYLNNAVLIYPNPVYDQARLALQVKKNTTLNLVITDVSGRMISSMEKTVKEGQNEITIPVNNLPAGIYQVVIIPEDKVIMSGKFLKTN
jgi:PKD repeat protein